MKYCPKCSKTLSKDNFYSSKGKLVGYCKMCWAENQKLRRTKERSKSYTLKTKFGITLDEYHKMYLDQTGLCLICKKPLALYAETKDLSNVACVDHNHTSNTVRGLLCNHCNTGIGLFKENIEFLQNAINYLLERGVK